jgi:regulator of protease activity HflC (stomatin/prohibitin superfamily)
MVFSSHLFPFPLSMGKKILIGFLVFFGLIALIAINPFTTIDAGERGVVLHWGAFQGQIFQPGLHLVVPIRDQVIKMNVRTNRFSVEKSEAYSKDLQVVAVESALLYQLDEAAVGQIYQHIGTNIEGKVIQPSLEAAIKQVIAKYTAEEILNQRAIVQKEIEDTVRAAVAANNVIVTQYAMVDEKFSADFENAIERKQVAEQDAKRAENELKRVKIEAEQRIAQAEAEATAIKLQSDAANNDKYVSLKALEVQLEAVRKWNGELPNSMIPGSALPFVNVPAGNR